MSDRGGGKADQPVAGYLRRLMSYTGGCAVILLATVVIVLGLTTVTSLYRGEPLQGRPFATTAEAEVGKCIRVGPVSLYGLGYWWECQATIVFPDGRRVAVITDTSVVTPEDRGSRVEVVQRCSRDGKDCVYRRPGNTILGLFVIIVGFFRNLLGFIGLSLVVVLMVPAILGRRLAGRLFRVKPDGGEGFQPSAVGQSAGDGMSAGDGQPVARDGLDEDTCDQLAWPQGIEINFIHTPGSLDEVYRSTTPRLSIDGREQVVPGWGVNYYPAPAGLHRVRIAMSVKGNEFAIAERAITVPSDARVGLEYRAPHVPLLKGSLKERTSKR